jgi:uncharacterized protein YhhL (DUF1145 family)
MIILVGENYSALEGQYGGSSLVPSLDMNLIVVNMLYRKLQQERKERSSVVVRGVWELRGIRKKIAEGRWPL